MDLSKQVSKPDEWFKSPEGRTILDNVVSWQNANGGWWKAYDATKPRTEEQATTPADKKNGEGAGFGQPGRLEAQQHVRQQGDLHRAAPPRPRVSRHAGCQVPRGVRPRAEVRLRRAVPQRRVAAAVPDRRQLRAAHHLQRRRDDRRDEPPARHRERQGRLRVGRRRAARARQAGVRPGRAVRPRHADQGERQAHRLVPAARREDARPDVGPHVRAALDRQQRDGRDPQDAHADRATRPRGEGRRFTPGPPGWRRRR